MSGRPDLPLVPEGLRADCGRCAGLCCVVPAFAVSADFALDKPARAPCPNLADDDACTIHAELRPRGFTGCTVYDCFGAGQRVVQEHFGGRSWHDPAVREAMFATFEAVERLHELLWYLREARELELRGPGSTEVAGLTAAVAAAAAAPEGVDVVSLQLRCDPLLAEVSARARAGLEGADLRGADLTGADLRTTDLVGATLRGALLLGADLRGVELWRTDLLGADLRGARVEGADLSGSLFLTQQQLAAGRGDGGTGVPDVLRRPGHWPAADGDEGDPG